jgi:hypothetical protein
MRNCKFDLRTFALSEDSPDAAIFTIIPRTYERFCKKEVEWFSTSDGEDDLTQWEKAELEINSAIRKSVAIECDIRLLDWKRLARI